ncbi:cysteine rich repeat-containing protein [Rhodoplanes azumiensis]|uniref:Cysteine rich repeat-containing protein n=1 Tax=Rhodoplanes azumiensis TaxID=1897628 RepID=A0ABW5ALM0_9BRAD
MRTTIVPAAGLAVLIALGAAPTPAHAQSSQDQMACQFDAQTYCQDAIPDHGKVYRCLQRNRAKISPACRAAISKGKAPRRNRPGTGY